MKIKILIVLNKYLSTVKEIHRKAYPNKPVYCIEYKLIEDRVTFFNSDIEYGLDFGLRLNLYEIVFFRKYVKSKLMTNNKQLSFWILDFRR